MRGSERGGCGGREDRALLVQKWVTREERGNGLSDGGRFLGGQETIVRSLLTRSRHGAESSGQKSVAVGGGPRTSREEHDAEHTLG